METSIERFECAKMAATKNAQGFGIGKSPALYAIDRVKNFGANEIYLQTSSKLITKSCKSPLQGVWLPKETQKSISDNIFTRPAFTMKLNLRGDES